MEKSSFQEKQNKMHLQSSASKQLEIWMEIDSSIFKIDQNNRSRKRASHSILSSPSSSQILILAICLILQSFQLCQSALLTNIYSKKLSEIKDINHRYLILPSPLLKSQSNINSNQEQQQQQQAPQVLDGAANQDEIIEEMMMQADQPAPMALKLMAAGTGNTAPPIWLKQGSSSNSNGNKKKFGSLMQPNLSSLETMAKISGEPHINEDISTEFPNPNINNLGYEISMILKSFFLHGYDKRVRPNYSGPPALVNVSFHIIGISSVDEVQMDFTTDFYFRQKWYDPRLEFEPVGEIDELCVGSEFAEKIWLPDTFFANEKTALFHTATTENTFIRIAHTGRVYRSIRLTVTCSCPMDLQYFPMDRQRCKIEIESYGYNTRDIDYRWERGDASVTLNTKIELPQFKILGFKMGQELQNLSSGDYIRLYCEIHFVRSMGYYLIQIYIPASLIVMISWVSFWLHRNATPARVALGVTTVLTMTTLMSSTNSALPKISYIKSIDVFLGTCFVMVFASLLEYASVGYIGKRIAMKRKRLQDLQQMQQHHQKVCVAAAASAAAAAQAVQDANPLLVPNYNQQQLLSSNNNNNNINNKGSPLVRGFNQQQLLLSGSDQNNQAQRTLTGTQTLHRRAIATSSVNVMSDNQRIIGSKTLQRNSTYKIKNNNNNQIESQFQLESMPHLQHNQIINNGNGDANGNSHGDGNNNNSSPSTATSFMTTTKKLVGAANRRRFNPVSPAEQTRLTTPLLSTPTATAAPPYPTTTGSHGPTTEFEVSQTHDMIKICGLTPSAIDKHSRVVFPICFVCFNLMYWIIYGHISQQIEDKGPPLIPFIKS